MPRMSVARAVQTIDHPVAGKTFSRIALPVRNGTGLMELAPDGRILFLNRSAQTIVGERAWKSLVASNLLGMSYSDLRQLAQSGMDPCECEIQLSRQNGQPIPVAIAVIEKMTPAHGDSLLIVLRSLVEERITSAVRERIRSSNTAMEIFSVLVEEINRWVKFAHCGASIYNENLSQARTVFSAGSVSIPWPYLWVDLTPAQATWLREANKGLLDFDKLQKDPRWKKAFTANTRKAMEGLKSAFRVPVVRNGRVSGSINFFKTEKNGFSDEFELDLLRNLPIDNVFLIALSYLENDEHRFRRDLAKQLADRKSPEILDNTAAAMIVNRLAQHYGWDAITICRVNRNTQSYELQATGGKKAEFIDPKFTQGLNEGGMGKAYRTGKPERVPDLSAEEYRSLFIKKFKVDMQSELCIPIRAGSEIIAMLNVEDSHANAFAETEVETITELLKNIGLMVKRQKDETIINAAFDWAPSALFVIAGNGAIEKINATALKLLGYKAGELLGESITKIMGPEKAAGKLVNGKESCDDMWLVPKKGKFFQVNVSSSRIGEGLGAIVIAKDVRSQQRIEELEGLERIFSDIAAQTKVPLALAYAELISVKQNLQAIQSPQSGKLANDLDKICRHLRRAEITYDHLALYDKSAPAGIPASPVIVQIGKLVEMLMGELPLTDAQRIHITGNALTVQILGDVYQVSWVLLALLSYGLRFLPESKKLEMAIVRQKKRDKEWVQFSIRTFVPIPASPARRKSDLFISRVISDLSLGRGAIEAFVRTNHGQVSVPETLEGPVELSVTFPVTDIAG